MVSRRIVLCAPMVVTALWPETDASAQLPAQQKVNKADAQYHDTPKGQQRCAICLQFEPPNSCKLVEGKISPQGWCQFFAARENAQ